MFSGKSLAIVCMVLFFHAVTEAQVSPVDLESQVASKIGADADVSKNNNETFVLYTKKTVDESSQMMQLKFLIVRLLDKRIVEEGSITMGQMEWRGNYQLQISPLEGQVGLPRQGQSELKTIDLNRYRK